MKRRSKFIIDVLESSYSMTELCEYYGISRKTGYKWIQRYEQSRFDAMKDLSRAPHCHLYQISHQVKESILVVKNVFQNGEHPRSEVVLNELTRTSSMSFSTLQSNSC